GDEPRDDVRVARVLSVQRLERRALADDGVHRRVDRPEAPFADLPLDLVLADDVAGRQVPIDVLERRVGEQRRAVVGTVLPLGILLTACGAGRHGRALSQYLSRARQASATSTSQLPREPASS